MMRADARRALSTIRRCIRADRVRLTQHFRVRLTERGVLWADVLTLFDAPTGAEADGFDDAGRARWIVRGRAAGGHAMGLVCAIGRDSGGRLTVFVTAYWEG
ncbi:MAG: DUF4258 domain-containing protein [Phycisphaerae bacterium]|nr:DUF4258 domain-containing protein [Phycisphaerae bacterium]